MKLVTKAFLLGIMLILINCRNETDEYQLENTEKIIFFKNYARDKNHRYMENWLNYENTNNPAIPFAQSLNAYWYLYPKHKIQIEEKYGKIHLGISSQVIIDNNTSKKTVFSLL